MEKQERQATAKQAEREPNSSRTVCDECGPKFAADEVKWSKESRALCPRCEWPV